MTQTTRQCGECTACCEGWLEGEVNGHRFSPSIPCYYLSSKGCSIYEERPDNPCKSFSCEWLQNQNYPEWMKPTESGTISFTRTFQRKDGSSLLYRVVNETQPMGTAVLFFYMRQLIEDQIPLRIQLNGNWHFFGPKDWVDHLTHSG